MIRDTQPPQLSAWAEPALLRSGVLLTPTAQASDANPIAGVWAEMIRDEGGELLLLYHPAEGLWWRDYYLQSPGAEGEGEKPFQVRASDAAGNQGTQVVTVTVDNTPPVGWVRINGGADFTNQRQVNLTLAATDAYTVAAMRLSNEVPPYGDWEPYTTGRPWTLASYDGARGVWVEFRDLVGNVSLAYSDTIILDRTPPTASIHAIASVGAYAHSAGNTVFYGDDGPGGFEVQVSAEDPSPGSGQASGLDRAEYSATVSAGGVYHETLSGAYQYAHAYSFTPSSQQQGAYQVRVYDRAGNYTDVSFTVTRDAVDPVVNLSAIANGTDIQLNWSASDAASGLATCALEVQKEGESTWTALSTACSGSDVYEQAEPRVRYTFRVTATDHVSNAASAEAQASTRHVVKYYYFGGQRVAVRQPDGVYYLHADHLGSTSLTTNSSGGVVARQLYHPFGTVRWASESPLPTDFAFTGQRFSLDIGLYQMGARWYSSHVGRFISPDPTVPGVSNPQAYNRYSWVLNNPLKFTDPSGHQCSIEYDPFTGSFGGKSCFGDQTGMGQTLTVGRTYSPDRIWGQSGLCGTAAQCQAAQDNFVKLIGDLLTLSFAAPLVAEAAPALGLIGTGAADAEKSIRALHYSLETGEETIQELLGHLENLGVTVENNPEFLDGRDAGGMYILMVRSFLGRVW